MRTLRALTRPSHPNTIVHETSALTRASSKLTQSTALPKCTQKNALQAARHCHSGTRAHTLLHDTHRPSPYKEASYRHASAFAASTSAARAPGSTGAVTAARGEPAPAPAPALLLPRYGRMEALWRAHENGTPPGEEPRGAHVPIPSSCPSHHASRQQTRHGSTASRAESGPYPACVARRNACAVRQPFMDARLKASC